HRPLRGREELERHWYASTANERCAFQSEHFLKTHRDHGRALIQIIDANVRAAGDLQMRGREGLELALLLPGEQRAQCVDQRDTREMFFSRDAIQPRTEPDFDTGRQSGIRY